MVAMQAFHSDRHLLPLPPGHRFPRSKYRLLRERVAALADLDAQRSRAGERRRPRARVHDPAYVAAVTSGTLGAAEQRAIGFPWSAEMVERSRRSVGATVAAARAALAEGVAANLAGGTHHAAAARGSGYCVFNDVAVAARLLQAESAAHRAIVVVDLDVHQGDGTAAIFAGDASVFTLSLHGAKNFPFRKAASDLDVAPAPTAAATPTTWPRSTHALAALWRRACRAAVRPGLLPRRRRPARRRPARPAQAERRRPARARPARARRARASCASRSRWRWPAATATTSTSRSRSRRRPSPRRSTPGAPGGRPAASRLQLHRRAPRDAPATDNRAHDRAADPDRRRRRRRGPRGSALAYRRFVPLATRWIDNDAYGHLNNVVY